MFLHIYQVAIFEFYTTFISVFTDEFYRYLHLIKKWNFSDINDSVSMFKVPFKKLEKYTIKMCADSYELAGYGNRIKYFVHHIQVNIIR